MSRHRDLAWQDRAACQGVDSEVFFPERESRKSLRDPLTYCHSCPVALECLTHALERPERFGIWGGSTEDQRAEIGRRRRALA